jgi:hypothetical protein
MIVRAVMANHQHKINDFQHCCNTIIKAQSINITKLDYCCSQSSGGYWVRAGKYSQNYKGQAMPPSHRLDAG